MSNDSIAGHCADCSFYRLYLLNYGRIIGIPFAAAAAGFVTFVKSNAKALLTLRIKSALRSPRGNGECGFCGSLRRGLQVVPTLQNPRRDRQSFSNRICCNAAAHKQRRFGKSSLPSISNSADFSMETGNARGQQPMHCLVCQPQERGTLLSQLPRRSRPAIALRHSTSVKILLPCLFPFLFGGSGLVLGIELSVQYGVKLLFQALPDFFVKIVLAVQMIEHQIIGYLYTFHSILSFL